MDIDSSSKMRRHENTSSSEEDDLVDLLGNTYQVNKKSQFFKMSMAIDWLFWLTFFLLLFHLWALLKWFENLISESDGYLL